MRDVGIWIAFVGGLLGLVAAGFGLIGAFHLWTLDAGAATFEAKLRTQDRLLNVCDAFLVPAGAAIVLGAVIALVGRGLELL